MSHQKDAVKSGYWPLYRFQPVARSRAASRSSSTRRRRSIPIARLRGDRDALRDPRAHGPGAGRGARGPGPGRRRRALALLRAARRHRAHRPAPPRARPRHRARGRERRRLPLRRTRETRHERRPAHPLPRPRRSARRSSPRPRRTTASRRWPRASRAPASGAIVLPSLFEEEILAEEIGLDRSLEQGTEQFAEALDYFPAIGAFIGRGGPLPRRARAGQGRGRRPGHRQPQRRPRPAAGSATRAPMQDAGADALELNLYHVAADPRRTAAEMEAVDLELIAAVRAAVTIPLAVKLSPYYSAFANFAAAARRGRRRRPRAVQPLLPAGPRPRHRSTSSRGSS